MYIVKAHNDLCTYFEYIFVNNLAKNGRFLLKLQLVFLQKIDPNIGFWGKKSKSFRPKLEKM
jgi:hypothetical protein